MGGLRQEEVISTVSKSRKGLPRKSKERTRDGRDEANGSNREDARDLPDGAVRGAESAATSLPRLVRHDNALTLDPEQVLNVGQELVNRELLAQERVQEHVSELTEKRLNGKRSPTHRSSLTLEETSLDDGHQHLARLHRLVAELEAEAGVEAVQGRGQASVSWEGQLRRREGAETDLR